MSQQRRSPLAGAWLVWTDSNRVRALYRSTFRASQTLKQVFVQEFDAVTPGAWFSACQSVVGQIRVRWPVSVQVALPQAMTPCFDVSLDGAKVKSSILGAYLNARFEQVYSQSSEGWLIRCDPGLHKGKGIAFACLESTVRELQALGAGSGRVMIVPSGCWGLYRARRLLRGKSKVTPFGQSGWYVQVESDRQVAMWIEAGVAIHVALLPAGIFSVERLQEQLARWEKRLKLTVDEAPILVGAACNDAFQYETSVGRSVSRIGLFGPSRDVNMAGLRVTEDKLCAQQG